MIYALTLRKGDKGCTVRDITKEHPVVEGERAVALFRDVEFALATAVFVMALENDKVIISDADRAEMAQLVRVAV